MTNIYYDCEFLEDGKTIELISIGMVSEDGLELYLVNNDMPWDRIMQRPWLVENVVTSLPTRLVNGALQLDRSNPSVRPKAAIANEVARFITSYTNPELWAYYAAYDHVVMCQLFGRMIDLPDGVPMYTNDLKQEIVRYGNPILPKQADGLHNALADAKWVCATYDKLIENTSL